jgi:alkyl hydroperoxide reductase subunit AhpF
MPILQRQDQEAVKERFDNELSGDVSITLFTYDPLGGLFIPGRECQTCPPARQLLEEVCSLSDKIELNIIDFYANPDEAKARGIERIPAIIISGNGSENVRYFGLPSGYEFAVLIDAITGASSEQSILAESTVSQLDRLTQDVHIQVFVTPQ